MTQIFCLHAFHRTMTHNLCIWCIPFTQVHFCFNFVLLFCCPQFFAVCENGMYWCQHSWLITTLLLEEFNFPNQVWSPACCMFSAFTFIATLMYLMWTLSEDSCFIHFLAVQRSIPYTCNKMIQEPIVKAVLLFLSLELPR